MKSFILQACVVFLLPLLADRSTIADTVYNVVPYELSRGYQVVGGTITTDDTVGEAQVDFFKANIIDYEIVVTGPLNLTFTPGNAGARIFNLDAGVVVTENEIFVEAQSGGNNAELRLEAREIFPGNVSPTIQQVFWSQISSQNPRSRVGFGDSGGPFNQGLADFTPMLDRLIIARVSAPTLMGDSNLDGVVNFLDIQPFVAVLSAGTYLAEADINEDGAVNFLDVGPFIAVLSS